MKIAVSKIICTIINRSTNQPINQKSNKFEILSMLKHLDWYIIKKYLGTFALSIVLIISISVIFDFTEKIDDFMETNAPVKAIVFDYYLNFIPFFTNMFTPLFAFISVIFFTSKLANNSEVFAV